MLNAVQQSGIWLRSLVVADSSGGWQKASFFRDMTKIPPAPEGWNKTFADLDAEYKSGARRTPAGSPEIDWARDYERSLLPADTRFPLLGDVYEVLEDLEVHYLTSWRAPFTGGGKGRLLRGDRIVVRYMLPKPIAVSADAVNYREIEARVVPESERKVQGYDGFSFSIKTADLNTKFRLVREGGGPESAQGRGGNAGPADA